MTSRRARSARSTAKHKARKPAPKQKKTESAPKETAAPPGVHLSISQAAEEFGHDRRTVTKRIAELGIRPTDERQGYAVYRLRDLLEMERKGDDGKHDPDKMSPFERQAHYKAEGEKLKVDLERRELMRREEAELEWSRVLKLIALELDVLVDEIERDVGASPLVLEKIEAKIDVVRQRIYDSIVADDHHEEQAQANGVDDGSRPVC